LRKKLDIEQGLGDLAREFSHRWIIFPNHMTISLPKPKLRPRVNARKTRVACYSPRLRSSSANVSFS
jgi:hypothetical protein